MKDDFCLFFKFIIIVCASVVDPSNFGTDPDPQHCLAVPDSAPDPAVFASG
jgi:hypothetical protein